MKKLLFILAALVLVASGIAAVSAYEAHLINVKAHVELALNVDTSEIDFGTVFPEEWLVTHREVTLSDSAVTELGTGAVGDLDNVEITLFAEWKPLDGGFYNWMGYFTYFGWNVDGSASQMTLVGDPPAEQPGAKQVAGPFTLDSSSINQLYVAIDAPDFEGFYNEHTDVPIKPSGLDAPTYIVTEADWGEAFDPQGMDFGLDLKIQVTDINRVVPTPQ